MGHKNLNKVLVPHVISMAEESIIVPRRPHAWIEGHVNGTLPEEEIQWRKSFGGGVSLDMIERMVAAPTFNASHQTSWQHLCGEDS